MKHILTTILILLKCHAFIFSQSFQKQYYGEVYDPLVFKNDDVGIALGSYYGVYDSMGNEKWASNFYNQYYITSAQETTDKGILLVGSNSSSPNVTAASFVVVKKDSIGNTAWAIAYTDTSYNVGYIEGTLPFKSGLIFYGRVSTNIPMQHWLAIVCRVDSTGNLVWGKLMDFGFNYPMRGIVTREEEMIFTGDDKIFKMDTSGNVIWAQSSYPLSASIRLKSVSQSPYGYYTILVVSNTFGTGIINIDTAGNFMNGKKIIANDGPGGVDIQYLTDSNLVLFGYSGFNTSPLCEYTFCLLDKMENSIIGNHLGISSHCNTAYKMSKANNGFVACGEEPFDDQVHLLKIDNAYQVDCADTFHFSVDTLSIAFTALAITSTNAFSQSTFVDSSTNLLINAPGYCGTTVIAKTEKQEVKLFPNPFKESFTLSMTNISTSKVIIYNSIGRQIHFSMNLTENKIEFDFQNEPPGVYFLKIFSEDNLLVKKIIKAN